MDLAERLETMRLPQLQQQMAKGPLTSVLVTKAYLLRCLRADKLDNSGEQPQGSFCSPR